MITVNSAFSQSSSALQKRKDMINKEIEQLKKSRNKIAKINKESSDIFNKILDQLGFVKPKDDWEE